jgi:hypothetical protein
MKIAILIPSRNRPRLLSAAITALHEMESGENEIQYIVGFDGDDWATQQMPITWMGRPDRLRHLAMPKEILTIGEIWNYLAREADDFYGEHIKQDIYSCMIDDAFPITPHWDKVIVQMAQNYEAFSWYEVSAPNNIGYPSCTKAWLDKVGYIVPEHFPFWFMDTWFAEMVWFITGQPVPVSQSLALYSKQEATHNLRDLQFWWDFFRLTRPMRVIEAHKIAGGETSLEDFTQSRLKFIALGESRDAEFSGAKIAHIEANKGVAGEPSERYLLAKARAEKYLQDNDLKI